MGKTAFVQLVARAADGQWSYFEHKNLGETVRDSAPTDFTAEQWFLHHFKRPCISLNLVYMHGMTFQQVLDVQFRDALMTVLSGSPLDRLQLHTLELDCNWTDRWQFLINCIRATSPRYRHHKAKLLVLIDEVDSFTQELLAHGEHDERVEQEIRKQLNMFLFPLKELMSSGHVQNVYMTGIDVTASLPSTTIASSVASILEDMTFNRFTATMCGLSKTELLGHEHFRSVLEHAEGREQHTSVEEFLDVLELACGGWRFHHSQKESLFHTRTIVRGMKWSAVQLGNTWMGKVLQVDGRYAEAMLHLVEHRCTGNTDTLFDRVRAGLLRTGYLTVDCMSSMDKMVVRPTNRTAEAQLSLLIVGPEYQPVFDLSKQVAAGNLHESTAKPLQQYPVMMDRIYGRRISRVALTVAAGRLSEAWTQKMMHAYFTLFFWHHHEDNGAYITTSR